MARVLIVDDDATNRALVATLLRYGEHASIEAADGEAALALVRTERPDLVICDILMPVMDGYEFVRALRAEPALAHTQVIFYTATFLSEQAHELAARCGVDEVLVKPCEPQDILAAIERALARQAGRADDLPTAPGPDTAAQLEFDRRHLRLVTDQLLSKVEELEATNQRLSALVASALDAIVGLDPQHRVVLFNPAAEAMFGWPRDEMLGRPFTSLLPQTEHGALAVFEAAPETQRAQRLQGQRRDGQAFPLEASFAKTGDAGLSITVILRDVTEQVQAETRVRRFARVATVLSDINSLIARVRQRDELFQESCRIAVEVGCFVRAWIGTLAVGDDRLRLSAFCGDDRHGYAAKLDAALQAGPLVPIVEPALREDRVVVLNDLVRDAGPDWPMRAEALASGTRAVAWVPLASRRGPEGVLVLHADTPGVFDEQELRLLKELSSDMSFALEHLAQQDHLERLAFYDPLTGLANESLLRERLGQQWLAPPAGAVPRRQLLMLVDLVHFKRINDTIGRRAGDALLRAVAERLTVSLGERSRLARLVADRFAAVVPLPDVDPARLLADQHQRCFGQPFDVEGDHLRVDARFGVAVCPDHGTDADALIRHAEVALKHAKAGSEPIVFYEERMSAALAETLALETELRRALERDEFVLHYQPKVDVDTRRLTGVEALLRWQSPVRGLVSPLAFIGVLEETGLIVPVGLWALQRAAQDHRRWRECFGEAPSIAVNVSAVQLRRDAFVEEVMSVLDTEGARRGAIDLEVTESLLMHDIEASIAKLQSLQAQEVCIAIDDFGTGYSSLAYLSKLPASVLKIDRSFISAMMADPDAMTLVSTMISLAHSLRMRVVAEGVETEEQAKILRLLRCDQMQGFLISKAVPQETLLAMLGTEQG